ncbi:hypothetical protein RF11_15315 [Thelohanellus kitauei]|uniref:Uncharacterized protein n=1 Tax=Thelohanellus kitauei TaxID=669202 RepID=A0A0C2ML34_THEKT|nr:hypothetical protein RF11_15315 [Thelohanellus kitauei]
MWPTPAPDKPLFDQNPMTWVEILFEVLQNELSKHLQYGLVSSHPRNGEGDRVGHFANLMPQLSLTSQPLPYHMPLPHPNIFTQKNEFINICLGLMEATDEIARYQLVNELLIVPMNSRISYDTC